MLKRCNKKYVSHSLHLPTLLCSTGDCRDDSPVHLALSVYGQKEINLPILGSYGYTVKDSALGHMPTTGLVTVRGILIGKERRTLSLMVP